jgi:hypothetical protein
MKERERVVVGGLVALLLLLWLGYLFHSSAQFAGSAWGGVLAVSGSLLMLVPLAYSLIKRIPALKRKVIRHVAMRTLLTWHIYAGILGSILVIAHTGHKYESTLGIALTAMTLLVVVSGFVGRYLLNQIAEEIRAKQAQLGQLEGEYRRTATELAAHPEQIALLRPLTGFWRSLLVRFFVSSVPGEQKIVSAAVRAVRLSEAMADLEYAIKTHASFKCWFAGWLRFHLVLSVLLYVLLALHVWAGIHFGLRWFQ